ncbi:hypothetical protein PG984_005618 [Apiospora sp. TS-2023a]
MEAAPQSVLSLLGAAKDLLQPKHTMGDFDWMEDKQGTEASTMIKTLRNDLTGRLPELLPEIRYSMAALFDSMLESPPLSSGVRVSPILPIVSRAIAQSNAFVFFGRELSQNNEFITAGIAMIEHTLIISDIIRLLPQILSDPIGKLLAGRLNSSDIVYNALEPLVARRFEDRDRARMGYKIPEHQDCVQWIMENAPKTKPWTVKRVVHELVALWYGSVHITYVTACFALLDLCNHEEYVAPLRQEIENTGWEAFAKAGGRAFPLMDSFMKESSRLNPVECMSTRRKALKPFHFKDGTQVKKGEWVCSPLAGLNLDPRNHACPDEFHGFRFVEPHILNTYSTEFSTNHTHIPDLGCWEVAMWGRFYASSVIKTMLGLFLTKWDLKLEDPQAKQHFAWRSWIYPYASTKVIVRPRA